MDDPRAMIAEFVAAKYAATVRDFASSAPEHVKTNIRESATRLSDATTQGTEVTADQIELLLSIAFFEGACYCMKSVMQARKDGNLDTILDSKGSPFDAALVPLKQGKSEEGT